MTHPIAPSGRARLVLGLVTGSITALVATGGVEAQTTPPAAEKKAPSAARKSPRTTAAGATARRSAAAKPAAVEASPPPADAAAEAAALLAQIRKERQELEAAQVTTVKLIRLMVEDGVIPREKAQQLLPARDRDALSGVVVRTPAAAPAPAAEGPVAAPAPAAPPEKGVVRVPYIPEIVRNEMRDQIRQDVLAQAKAERWGDPGTLPAWMDRINFNGDLRLRYQGEYYGADNADPTTYYAVTGALRDGQPIGNTQTNVDGFRFRFRLGVTAKVTDTFSIAARLATGRSPVSANPRLGQYGDPDGFRLVVDRAAIVWNPSASVSAQAGRIGNPWFWPTDLVWYEDLNFEGGAFTFKPKLTGTTEGFVTLGAFQMEQVDPTQTVRAPRDKSMVGAQAGAEWIPDRNVGLKVGVAYFHYQGIEGQRNTIASPNANDWTAPPFRQKGNSVFDINAGTGQAARLGLASRFHIVNVSGALDLGHLDPLHVRLSGDYARNIGFDQGEIRSRTGLDFEARTTAYQTMLTLGNADVWGRGNTSVFLGYRYVEPDAVVDAFTQANVLLGGTNAKGYMLGINYGVDSNVWMRWRWLTANAIYGPALAIDVLQGDLMLKF
jgi:hypothetical protein